MDSENYYSVTEKIIGFAMKIHRALGPGFLESVYLKALIHELRRAGFSAETDQRITVRYENVIVGDGVVMGNSCEFKNCILFDEAQVPHFSYVGDSILGYKAHLGAGVILSNVKLDHGEIAVTTEDGPIATGLTKFGAIVGDRTEIGCNAVINPGSVLGRDCIIYPGANFRGVLPDSSIVKVRQQQQVLARREPTAT